MNTVNYTNDTSIDINLSPKIEDTSFRPVIHPSQPRLTRNQRRKLEKKPRIKNKKL
jgi:hypothetical protein